MTLFEASGLTMTFSSITISAAYSFCYKSYSHIMMFMRTCDMSFMNLSYRPAMTIAYAYCKGYIVVKYSKICVTFMSLSRGFKFTSSSFFVCIALRSSVTCLITVSTSSIYRCFSYISIIFAFLISTSFLGIAYNSIRKSSIACCSYRSTSFYLANTSVNRLYSLAGSWLPSILFLHFLFIVCAISYRSRYSFANSSASVSTSAILPYCIHSLHTTFL